MDNWHDILQRASANNEDLRDLTITTLASHYSDVVLSEVFRRIDPRKEPNLSYDEQVQKLKQEIADSGSVQVRQFISIDDNFNVSACIDVPEINNEVIDQFIDNLGHIDFSQPGTIKIGDPKTFTYNDIRNINELKY